MDAAAPGTIGGTYIGSPLACAASLATIQYMKDINLNARANEIGEIVMSRFEDFRRRFKEVGDIRGMGAMTAIEFVKDGDSNLPDGELCQAIIQGCFENGLIIISAGTYKNVIRILSPLVISNELLNRGLDIIENQLTEKINNRL
jgi:4-aminobutyrate aminotransferase/(S)-3-amino-2-methylpropionate transaminase